MFFYNGIFPFIADARYALKKCVAQNILRSCGENKKQNKTNVCFFISKFIQDKYTGYSQKEASYIAGAVYDCSLVLSAIVGILIVSPSLGLWLKYEQVSKET